MENRIPCGFINEKYLNKNVNVAGWIKKNRKLGSLIFIDLYDKSGLVQIVVDSHNKNFDECYLLTKESCVCINGDVRKRSNPNKEIPTGLYEIRLKSLKIFSKSETTPIEINDEINSLEDIRFKYRYLDLRRKPIQNNIILRSKIISSFRKSLEKRGFLDFETPILSKQTPEGARDYLVPTRLGKFYSLPQSPQIYKQLLMIAGFENYYQIAKCFRDEDLRADRQPEFTQLDIETSFLNQEEIISLFEEIIVEVFNDVLHEKITKPFLRMSYDQARTEYGSDKPDLRFDCKIVDLTEEFKDSSFNLFKNAVKEKKCVKAVCVPNKEVEKNIIKTFEKYALDNNAKGLAWVYLKDKKLVSGSIIKILDEATIAKILKSTNITTGTIFFIADTKEISLNALGAIRKEFANLNLVTLKSKFKFCWIIDWPLFEYSKEDNRYVSAHHPFTLPDNKYIDNFEKDPKNAKAQAYDIVLNGYEVGGGSLRIYNSELQNRMFKFLGLTQKEIDLKFGFLLNAFKYGVPPHGGIAFGLDRLIMLMLDVSNIREIIVFPKNSSGYDLMLDTPSMVDNVLLDELKLQIK